MMTPLMAATMGRGGKPVEVPRYHVPVLLQETLQALNVQPGGRYVDCTLGSAGHSLAILEASAPGGQLLAIDADPRAVSEAAKRLSTYKHSTLLINDNFVHLREICSRYGFIPVNGILFDLGLSSLQLEWEDRGFSFQRESPLDMRFDPAQELTAADIVNTYDEKDLADIISTYGEEPRSRQIARQIVAHRPIRTTLELASVVARAAGGTRGRIHPATRTFQALRIAVNQELANLRSALEQAVDVLGFGGRLVVISYHSLEDRIVKHLLRQESMGCICPPSAIRCVCGHTPRLNLVTRKAIVPTAAEVEANPRSRSAKLRVAERVLPNSSKA